MRNLLTQSSEYVPYPGADAIPLTVLTGFLGAGKTTLLNRILSGSHGLRVAVLVNDFGAINIDADLVFGVEDGMISLSNGCVCCSIRDDLLEAVTRVLERSERPEYVLLEASGVAEPSGIMVTFANESVRDRIRLDSITCVLDAEQVFAAPEQIRLKLFQIAFADLLILNKVDLIDDAQRAKIKAWLDEHFHRYRLIEAERGNVPLEVLLSCGRFDATRLGADDSVRSDPHCGHDRHDHAQDFSTMSYETDRPFSLALLRDLVARLPADIYRCKGVIHSIDAPQRRAVLQVVGKRVDISLENEWGSRPPRTKIVAIGAPGAISADELRAKFDQCVAVEEGKASTSAELSRIRAGLAEASDC